MKRIDRLMANSLYKEKQKRLDELEGQRIYCRHGFNHAISVARIMYIKALEKNLSFDKELIYAVALIHDIGRCDQYESGIPHHEAGEKLAGQILPECGFREDEIAIIKEAIRSHREIERSSGSFQELLYEADKLSRECYRCRASDTCNWSEEKKNHTICY